MGLGETGALATGDKEIRKLVILLVVSSNDDMAEPTDLAAYIH